MDCNRFTGKVCLVTGAASGIGKATALRFGVEGAKVMVIDIDEEHGKQAVEEMKAQNLEAIFVKCDVGNEDDIKNAVDTALNTWGKIDVMVNNAAIMTFKKIVDLTKQEWDKVLNVNLTSVFLFCKYCIPHMNKGAIVNISSVHAHETTANVVPYASSKGAMEAFIRGVSLEYPNKIRINCVAPGAVDTPMLWENPNIRNGAEEVSGVIGKPEDIAAAVCFVAADEAAFVNGTTIVVDGGRLAML